MREAREPTAPERRLIAEELLLQQLLDQREEEMARDLSMVLLMRELLAPFCRVSRGR